MASQPTLRRTDRLTRRREGRLVAGVASGVAAQFDVDVILVRIGFVVLALASGVGVVLYGVAWALLPEDDGGAPLVRPRGPAARAAGGDWVQAAAWGAVVVGFLLLLRTLGLWFPDRLVWPVVLAAVGLALVWGRDRPTGTGAVPSTTGNAVGAAVRALSGTGRRTAVRVGAGLVLVVAGAGAFVAANGSLEALRQGFFGGLVLAAGLGLILAPWLWRLTTELADERRERIRSQERADLAAHLHDSVLQTLAIIQRRADHPREVVSLARRQERELRTWLYGMPTGSQAGAGAAPDTIGELVERAADEVEADMGVRVEVVRVGDCPADEPLMALGQAAREAIVNAAKHAGVDAVSVYVEVEPEAVAVFVRDRGAGFDPSAVAPDRRGIADSIVGRLGRQGGRAQVRSAPGEGTEVELTMPRRDA